MEPKEKTVEITVFLRFFFCIMEKKGGKKMNTTNWETIEENSSYAGDLYTANGRRVIVIVHQGRAFFARCTVENYHVNIEDFAHVFADLEFECMAEWGLGGVVLADKVDEYMDSYELEQVVRYLERTAS